MENLLNMFRSQYTGTPDGVGPLQPEQQNQYQGLMDQLGQGEGSKPGGWTTAGLSALDDYRVAQVPETSLQSLMGMLGSQKPQQAQRPGQQYQNPYISGLMGSY